MRIVKTGYCSAPLLLAFTPAIGVGPGQAASFQHRRRPDVHHGRSRRPFRAWVGDRPSASRSTPARRSASSSSTPIAGSHSGRSRRRDRAARRESPDPRALGQHHRQPDAAGQPGALLHRRRPRHVSTARSRLRGTPAPAWCAIPGTTSAAPIPIEAVLGSRGGWDFGFNIGAGIGFGLGDSGEFYIESKYRHVWGPEIGRRRRCRRAARRRQRRRPVHAAHVRLPVLDAETHELRNRVTFSQQILIGLVSGILTGAVLR